MNIYTSLKKSRKKEISIVRRLNIDLLNYDKCSHVNDNILISSFNFKIHSGNISVGISNHMPQFLFLEDEKDNSKPTPTFYKDWKKFDTDHFKNRFHNVNWKQFLKIKKDPSQSYMLFYNKISELVDQSVPIKKLSRKQQKRCGKLWITGGINPLTAIVGYISHDADVICSASYRQNYKKWPPCF